MTTDTKRRVIGYSAAAGGALGLLLAPIMVIIKYMTGWAIIPKPAWIAPTQQWLGGLLEYADPPRLWTVFGTVYTVALVLMLIGLVGLRPQLATAVNRVQRTGYWLLLGGMCLVIPGDAIHSWTWHQNGLTMPTPGTNPLANTAYAVHMMGVNVVMVGALILGAAALRRKTLAPWVAWPLVLTLPAAILASVTALPTTPSGALWLVSGLMLACGYCVARGQDRRLVAA